MNDVGATTVLAFDNPWHVAGLVALAVTLRLWAAHTRFFDIAAVLRSSRAAVLEFIDSALIALLLVFCILRPFVVQAFFIPSGSMEPTLQLGDRILVNKFIYHFRQPEAGDIVVFRAPPVADHLDRDFIKRVVGTPGDRLAVVRYEGLYTNGEPVNEPYIKETPTYDWPDVAGAEVTVPERQLVVFGDNRNCSNDSHRWQALTTDNRWEPRPFLPEENVLGRATVIFWPIYRMRILR